MKKVLGLSIVTLLCTVAAFGQQTGSVSGRVSLSDGTPLPGAVVEAAADVLPLPRSTTTSSNGDYLLPVLPPGEYTLTFSMGNMATETRSLRVRLQQNTVVNVTMSPEAVEETIQVVGETPLIDPTSAEIKTAVDDETIDALPTGQQYRDLVKLIPGVQYTEDTVRGPSAGGSGQDNVYLFDGVSVVLPLFGTLSSEPSSHDVDQIAIVKGGAKATDFNRSGGFTINSVSKSGTNDFHGEASYQIQTEGMTGDRDTVADTEFDNDRDWTVVNLGGPVVRQRLFAYASYFRPTETRDSRSNLYGSVPDFEETRDELFGKLSFTPTDSLLIHGSYRDSDREQSGNGVDDESEAGSTSNGGESTLKIAILEGTWVVNRSSFLSFRATDFENEGASRPDNIFDFPIRADGSVQLDIANLDRQGLLMVPELRPGEAAYNAFVTPIIERYGFLQNGVRMGGGEVGGATTIDSDDFYRESYQAGYDYLLGSNVSHELHVGYQFARDEEDLGRTSNGWGLISVPGGRTFTPDGQPIFYEARFEQMSLLGSGGAVIPPIHSELETENFELNDTIRWNNWTVSAGVMLSHDTYFGQGLRPNSSNVSGFELALGHKYEMYDIGFDEMIQPRLGAVWAYNGSDTVFANYARDYPAASSLPRAASWARNLRASIRGVFDADGNLIGTDPVASSSGKFFADDLDPRSIDEYVVGTARQLSPGWTARASARYRYGANFWEDTNNNARLAFEPPAGIPQELYIPNLDVVRSEIGGSSYVIAELDGAFTKYWEASLEAEWRGSNNFVRGSYVWSHYYGNFDQDNSTTGNDDNIFIGSSFIADGAGRQLWDSRYGDLRGDRRHQLKVYGYHNFDWNGTAGVFAIYQSGQPWEIWDVEVYRHLTSSSSDTSRFAEPAGSRKTDDHYQIDLTYSQDFAIGSRYNIQLRADLYNLTDNQTGYNIQNQRNGTGAPFLEPRDFYDPRRLQLAVKFQF
jgi:hypothetical protein